MSFLAGLHPHSCGLKYPRLHLRSWKAPLCCRFCTVNPHVWLAQSAFSLVKSQHFPILGGLIAVCIAKIPPSCIDKIPMLLVEKKHDWFMFAAFFWIWSPNFMMFFWCMSYIFLWDMATKCGSMFINLRCTWCFIPVGKPSHQDSPGIHPL